MLTVLFQYWFRLINHEFSLSQLTYNKTFSFILNSNVGRKPPIIHTDAQTGLESLTAHTVRHSHSSQHELKHTVTHTFTHAQRET